MPAVRACVEALAAALDARDCPTGEHSEGVVRLACSAGRRLGLDAGSLRELEFAARLHDVGKIAIPDTILRKPAPLDPGEWEVMRRHPEIGADLIGRVPELSLVAEIVRSAHERWDGRGYPYGLAGDDIPLASRIIFVCDAYHAMVCERPYREALDHDQAVAELCDCAGSQFDPRVVEALVGRQGLLAPAGALVS